MTSRPIEGYNPHFDHDYAWGRQGELFVEDIRNAIVTERIETKNDAQFEKTGNIYVEFECLMRGEKYEPSGIAITKAEYYVFVLHDSVSCVVVRTEELKSAVRDRWRAGHVRECTRGSHPTRGVTVPLMWLLQQGTRSGDGERKEIT